MIVAVSSQKPFNQPANQSYKTSDGKTRYRLTDDYEYRWDYKGKLYRIRVFNGYDYDGGSIPELLKHRFGLNPDGLGRAGFLLHDVICECEGWFANPDFRNQYTYEVRKGRLWVPCHDPWNDEDAARLMHRVHADGGVNVVQRRAMFYAVRCFGPRFDGLPDI